MNKLKNMNGASRYQAVTRENIRSSPVWKRLSRDLQEAVQVVSAVLPFRTNTYVIDELIDWGRVPEDPMYQLTFPQRGMLHKEEYAEMARLVTHDASRAEIRGAANRIRCQLSPHPAGQLTHNRPSLDGVHLDGMQHKYKETVLFFPSQGQTCHAYCSYCFRWPQFVGDPDLRIASSEVDKLVHYLLKHTEVTDVLLTGGDPMVMKASVLAAYIEPLLRPELEHVTSIRIGTKSLAYWPQRFVSDADANDLLRLFGDVVASGRHLTLMGHYSHPVELATTIAQEAVRRVRSTGVVIRMQSPIVRRVNDDSAVLAALWRGGVRLGAIPYYMFVERDTGARKYFEIPLVRAWEIFRDAYSRVPGLVRSVRGPSMSTLPGKVRIIGVTNIQGTPVFVLEYLQARNPELVLRPFFAKFDAGATWFSDLEPAFRGDEPFFEGNLHEVHEDPAALPAGPPRRPSSLQVLPTIAGGAGSECVL